MSGGLTLVLGEPDYLARPARETNDHRHIM